LRKRCSTPQKQPAARVAVCVEDILVENCDCNCAADGLVRESKRVGDAVVTGLMKRERREGIAKDIA